MVRLNTFEIKTENNKLILVNNMEKYYPHYLICGVLLGIVSISLIIIFHIKQYSFAYSVVIAILLYFYSISRHLFQNETMEIDGTKVKVQYKRREKIQYERHFSLQDIKKIYVRDPSTASCLKKHTRYNYTRLRKLKIETLDYGVFDGFNISPKPEIIHWGCFLDFKTAEKAVSLIKQLLKEKNLRYIAGENCDICTIGDETVVTYNNDENGSMPFISIACLFVAFFGLRLFPKISNTTIGKIFILFVLTGLFILSVISRLSYLACEKLILTDNKIILSLQDPIFEKQFRKTVLNNNQSLKLWFNNVYQWKNSDREYEFRFLDWLFPSIFSRLEKRVWPRCIFQPSQIKGMHFNVDGKEYAFGVLMVKEDYDEILALILAQRAKWDKEHPEDVIAPEPEGPEAHTVDSTSQ
ncbi:MAG: hypothetical protein LBQ97_06665 [Fusobacteriaceae bacterium]|nr:hypothetical protein [Fusobacteriaceae bacterium]